MNHHTNIVRIKAIYNALKRVEYDYVFVGGAVVSLYADRPAGEVRETDDIDILIEIYSRYDYLVLEEKLRQLGFKHDTSSNFVGRFLIEGLIIDFMPLDEKVLGFNNRWYAEGLKNAIDYVIDDLDTIKIFAAPYFIAAKLEAFKSRGKNANGELDGRLSSDFEDVVFLLSNRMAIWEEMKSANKDIREYLVNEFTILLKNPYFEEWIDAQTGYMSSFAQAIILPQVKDFISGK